MHRPGRDCRNRGTLRNDVDSLIDFGVSRIGEALEHLQSTIGSGGAFRAGRLPRRTGDRVASASVFSSPGPSLPCGRDTSVVLGDSSATIIQACCGVDRHSTARVHAESGKATQASIAGESAVAGTLIRTCRARALGTTPMARLATIRARNTWDNGVFDQDIGDKPDRRDMRISSPNSHGHHRFLLRKGQGRFLGENSMLRPAKLWVQCESAPSNGIPFAGPPGGLVEQGPNNALGSTTASMRSSRKP